MGDKDRGIGRTDDDMGHYVIHGSELNKLFDADAWTNRDLELIMPTLTEKEKKSKALRGRESAGTIKISISCKELDLVAMTQRLADIKEGKTESDKFKSSGNPEKDLEEATEQLQKKEEEGDSLTNTLRDLESEGNKIERKTRELDSAIATLKADVASTNAETMSVRGNIKEMREERDNLDKSWKSAVNNELLSAINAYLKRIQNIDTDDNVTVSGDLFKSMVSDYKKAKDAGNEAQDAEADTEFQNAMLQWRDNYEAAFAAVQRSASSRGLFASLFTKMCRLLFSLQVMGASLSVFKKEFTATGHKPRDMTLDAVQSVYPVLIPNNPDDPEDDQVENDVTNTVWSQVWGDMNFVIEDLNRTLGDAELNGMALKRLCEKATALIDGSFGGNPLRLARNLADSTAREVARRERNSEEEQKGPNVNDLVYAFVLLIDDKKDFLKALKQSADKASASAENGGDENENESVGSDGLDGDAVRFMGFESIAGQVIVTVAQLRKQRKVMLEDSSDEGDRKKVEADLKDLKESLQMDEATRKIVEAFLDRVFKPEGFEFCSCEPGSFFGSLFGGLCN